MISPTPKPTMPLRRSIVDTPVLQLQDHRGSKRGIDNNYAFILATTIACACGAVPPSIPTQSSAVSTSHRGSSATCRAQFSNPSCRRRKEQKIGKFV